MYTYVYIFFYFVFILAKTAVVPFFFHLGAAQTSYVSQADTGGTENETDEVVIEKTTAVVSAETQHYSLLDSFLSESPFSGLY